ncbi:MAG TPA: hypothetical protein PKE42_03845, partial [Arachnia sp.]|nr:hypothetical protein [Arachnia sp.]
MFPSAALSWVSTAATALLFVLVGFGIDGVLSPGGLWAAVALVVVAAAASALAAARTQRAVGAEEGRLRRRLVRAVYDGGVAGAGP